MNSEAQRWCCRAQKLPILKMVTSLLVKRPSCFLLRKFRKAEPGEMMTLSMPRHRRPSCYLFSVTHQGAHKTHALHPVLASLITFSIFAWLLNRIYDVKVRFVDSDIFECYVISVEILFAVSSGARCHHRQTARAGRLMDGKMSCIDCIH